MTPVQWAWTAASVGALAAVCVGSLGRDGHLREKLVDWGLMGHSAGSAQNWRDGLLVINVIAIAALLCMALTLAAAVGK